MMATRTLVELRQETGLSQAEVADRVNQLAVEAGHRGAALTANTVSRWERGQNTPSLLYRRLLAQLFGVEVSTLAPVREGVEVTVEALLMDDAQADVDDPRVVHSQREWVATRQALNSRRPALTRLAVELYPRAARVADTGLIAAPSWIPAVPVPLERVALRHDRAAPLPKLDGTESESAPVRPLASLTRPYPRYTQAVRDLDRPRLFENRAAWRLLGIGWSAGAGEMVFADTSFFAAVDVNEVAAHEMAYVHLDPKGRPVAGVAHLRGLPFRRLVGDPFDFARRPIMPAVSTLTIRAGNQPSFILHRRDSRSVAMAGGMLQVIPSGIFQPSSVLPAAVAADFSLWRNIQREYAEELMGYPELDGDGQPISYEAPPFAELDAARAAGRLRLWCLGVALDALTLVGEILTVAVVDADVFDVMARDFVEVNEEGTVINERLPFTEQVVASVLGSGRMAPAGAGCLLLAWRHREVLLG